MYFIVLKMKIINANSKHQKEQKFKNQILINQNQGITIRLLEKYKPKGLYNKEAMSNSNKHKGVALNYE